MKILLFFIRLKFDVGAVTRRLYHPRDSDLAEELERCCNILKCIRKGDVTEWEDSTVDDNLNFSISPYALQRWQKLRSTRARRLGHLCRQLHQVQVVGGQGDEPRVAFR